MAHSATVLIILLVAVTLAECHVVSSSNEDYTPNQLAVIEDYEPDVTYKRNSSGGGAGARHCCVRHKHYADVGVHESTGQRVRVDVGECRSKCHHRRHVKREHFQKMLRDNPDMDPKEVFLLARAEQGCQQCAAVQSRLEHHATVAGSVAVTITEECGCGERRATCTRVAKSVKVHEGTPLETAVDVGHCAGRCGHSDDDTSCKAIQSRTIAVEGPNGSECMSVVSECGCVGNCYRVAHLQQLYNYTDTRQIQVVDVGRCEGSCAGQSTSDTCVHRSSANECLMSLRSRPQCVASNTRTLLYIDQHGDKQTITSVGDCTCQ